MSEQTDPQAPAREQEIRERCEKATKGPWRARAEIDRGDDLQGTATLYTVCAGKEDWRDNKGHFHPDDARYVIDEIHVAGCGYDRDYGYPEGGIQRKEDASFIAHAREDVPYLLDALASLREDHARLQQSQQELAAELMAAINEPMYAGSRADWKYRAEAAESREAALQQQLAGSVAPEELRQWKQAVEDGLKREAALREALTQMAILAKRATNGWACYASRQIEHAEIARLHDAIDKGALLAAPTGSAPTQEK